MATWTHYKDFLLAQVKKLDVQYIGLCPEIVIQMQS